MCGITPSFKCWLHVINTTNMHLWWTGVCRCSLYRPVTVVGRGLSGASQVDYTLISDSDIQNLTISRFHARIVRTGNTYVIHDDSLNGIFINNVKIAGLLVCTLHFVALVFVSIVPFLPFARQHQDEMETGQQVRAYQEPAGNSRNIKKRRRYWISECSVITILQIFGTIFGLTFDLKVYSVHICRQTVWCDICHSSANCILHKNIGSQISWRRW